MNKFSICLILFYHRQTETADSNIYTFWSSFKWSLWAMYVKCRRHDAGKRWIECSCKPTTLPYVFFFSAFYVVMSATLIVATAIFLPRTTSLNVHLFSWEHLIIKTFGFKTLKFNNEPIQFIWLLETLWLHK